MRTLIIALAILASSPTLAADPQKFTLEQVMQISVGLSQLNCGNRIIKDGAKETQVCDNYKWSAGLTWLIATNQRKTQDVVAQYSKVRNQAVANLVRKPDGTVTDEAAAKFAVQEREFLDETVSVELDHFKKSDLEPMNLQPSVIAALILIID